MKDSIAAFAFVVFVIPFISCIIVFPIYYIERSSCISYGERTNQPSDYSFVNGCMIKSEGTWKPSTGTLEIINK